MKGKERKIKKSKDKKEGNLSGEKLPTLAYCCLQVPQRLLKLIDMKVMIGGEGFRLGVVGDCE